MKILVINGPNLNMLGIREPGIYGKNTFADLCALLDDTAKELGVEVEFFLLQQLNLVQHSQKKKEDLHLA